MEEGSQSPPPEKYEKPELTKHDDLTQVTFSSHEEGAKTQAAPATNTKKFHSPAAAIMAEGPYKPGPNRPKRQHSFSQMLNGEKK